MWKLPEELPRLSDAKMISLDIETRDDDLKSKGPGVRRDGYIVGIAVGTPDGLRTYLPFQHAEGHQFEPEVIIRWAKSELCRPGQPKVGANLLYDLDYLYEAGVEVTGPFYDVLIAEPLINENLFKYNLDSLSIDHLGETEGKFDKVLQAACDTQGWKGHPQAHIWKLPPEFVGEYAEADVDRPLRILEKQKKILVEEELVDLFLMETELIPLLLHMRRRGVRINRNQALKIQGEMGDKLQENERKLLKMAGFEVDIWAAASIAKAFDKAGLEYPRTLKTKAPSFQKLWLERHEHPIAQLIMECRKIDKFKGTFIEGSILNMAINGRIHCQFNQLKGDENGTVTGRFSSSNPNLQFIPKRDKILGPLIRSIFIPEEGEEWGRADYSQIELRILAHFALGEGAEVIRDAYRNDPTIDFHQKCADMAECERKKAKTINFGVVYGMGVEKLSRELELTIPEAKSFLERYHSRLPFAKHTLKIASDRAAGRGYVKTIMKRRRRFNNWEPRDWKLSKTFTPTADREGLLLRIKELMKEDDRISPGVRRAGTYKALNAIIQGSAADLMKKAMVDVWNSGVCDILGPPLLTIHDELDVSKPKTKAGDEAFKEMVHLMEYAIKFKVPVLVDAQIGANWGECD